MEATMIISDSLRETIKDMQMNNCEGAHSQIVFLGTLIRDLLRSGCIMPGDDADTMKMMQHLSYIQMIFESFIPPKQ